MILINYNFNDYIMSVLYYFPIILKSIEDFQFWPIRNNNWVQFSTMIIGQIFSTT